MALRLSMFDKEGGFDSRLFGGGFALGLEGFELSGILLHGAANPAFVDGQQGEVVGLFGPGLGLRERSIDFVITGVDGFDISEAAICDDAVFEGAGALQPVHVLGHSLTMEIFHGADVGEVGADIGAELPEDIELFGPTEN